jgi:Arc/MetJ-type ribon-helix-helix transcriptional regulator
MATALDLDPDTLRELDDLVASGRFPSREDAIRTALRLVHEQDRTDEAVDLDSLDPGTRAAVEEGLTDVAAGRVEDADIVFARLRERYASWPRAAG